MGCDIHFFVEKLNSESGKWEPVGDEGDFYDDRNYRLFGILADVRNGVGFAGCDTGDRFNPIAEPRGLPVDVSQTIATEYDEWGDDGHSHSFFTLKELLDYDWSQVAVLRGYVDESGYKHFKEHRHPNEWCGNTFGSRIEKITNMQMDDLLAGILKRDNEKYYHTQIQWTKTYQECAGDFFTKTIPALQELVAYDDTESVRIVFWFDN
jgi:hypothetical protein